MNILDWVPAISTTSLLVIVMWLMRSLISTRLTNSVQFEFNRKLAILRAQLRQKEESFRADLRAKDDQIELLRRGAISALTSRQEALDKRRIEGVDQLWSALIDLAPAKSASMWMATIKFEAAAKEAESNPKFRRFFELIGGELDIKKLGSTNTNKVRPFVSEMAWAIFSAYRAMVIFSASQLYLLKAGINEPKVLDHSPVTKLVQAVLPHHSKYLEEYGAAGYHHLLDELESGLLKELQNILQGVASDKASVEQAAAILQEADRVMEALSRASTKS